MEIYLKLFEVIFPVFFVVGIGYYLGKKDKKFDTTTEKIASFIHKTLDADGVFVKMSAKHLCSDLLNSQNSSEEVITTYSTGVYELDFSLRNEALLNFS